MQKNYQTELDRIISQLDNAPNLLLHSCCAPCSSYVIKYLSKYFNITVFYFNPNITEIEEYNKRALEQRRLINEMETVHAVKYIEGEYDPAVFTQKTKGYEDCREGGDRCRICFKLRLDETAQTAKAAGADYFATTLTVSPHKNAEVINKIGERCATEYGVKWLSADFKKNNGYQRSIELSRQYRLYRQNYCGCKINF